MESTERRARFEREMLAHLDGLYAFALKLARTRHDAEDLVSDTVLRALERWEQYQLDTNIRGWLFTILYHLFVNRRRKIESRETPLEAEDGSPTLEPVGEIDPEGRFYDSFVDEEITRAIEALPDHYRTAVVLSDVHGFSYAEMAEILDVPEGTVKSRLFRGRKALQQELLGYAVDMGYLRPRAA
jgi:RNA polymerase sigma-70 factor, ECF subfamily